MCVTRWCKLPEKGTFRELGSPPYRTGSVTVLDNFSCLVLAVVLRSLAITVEAGTGRLPLKTQIHSSRSLHFSPPPFSSKMPKFNFVAHMRFVGSVPAHSWWYNSLPATAALKRVLSKERELSLTWDMQQAKKWKTKKQKKGIKQELTTGRSVYATAAQKKETKNPTKTQNCRAKQQKSGLARQHRVPPAPAPTP